MANTPDTPLGTVTNTNTDGGPGGGMGSKCLSGPAVFRDEQPTALLNQHEVNARSMARGGSGKGRRNSNPDVGGS